MDTRELLLDAASRPLDTARLVLAHLNPDTLVAMPEQRGNSIAWLCWHAARQWDVQLAELAGTATVWEQGGWAERLGVRRDADDFGLGDDANAVAGVRYEDAGLMLAYFEACAEAMAAYVATLSDDDLDVVVDERWDPPVKRGVRLVSIIDDAVAHLGQAAYVRGLWEDFGVGA